MSKYECCMGWSRHFTHHSVAGSCQVVFTVSCPHSKCLQVSSRNCGADESEVRRRMALSAEFMIFRVYVLCVVITEIRLILHHHMGRREELKKITISVLSRTMVTA